MKLEYINCNLCGKDDYIIKYHGISTTTGNKYSASSSTIIQDQIVECKHCGLIYVNPRPDPSEIISEYTKGTDLDYVSQEEGRIRTFKECLRFLEKYAKKGRILDIGCAAGFFLSVAKEADWDTYGVEPNKWMVEYGNKKFGLHMQAGTLETIKFPEEYFDVITMWDVLEHLPNPKQTLLEVNRILKKDGLLVVNYPNVDSLLARIFGRRWWFYLSVHLFYFTHKTINKMLEKTGFKQILTKRHFQTLEFGYLIYRLKPYSLLLHNLLYNLAKQTNLLKKQFKYYASQRLVLARKF